MDDREAMATRVRLDYERWHRFPPLDLNASAAVGTVGCVGILVFGGSVVREDVRVTTGAFGLPMPELAEVGVMGEVNPGKARVGFEATMDVSVVAALAPGIPITVYFAPRSVEGLVQALDAAFRDEVHSPSVLSISYGMPEAEFSEQEIAAVNRQLQRAAERGITVCCSTGDLGSHTRINDGQPHVEFPGSSPWVLACGGALVSEDSQGYSVEVLNRFGLRTGGGVSQVHPLPDWQRDLAKNWNGPLPSPWVTRGVPDVCAHAGEFPFFLNGLWMEGAGTSIAAPVWAALIARCNAALGRRLGYVNPLLYRPDFRSCFREVLRGTNGHYQAGPGWNACSGLGLPDGIELLAAFRKCGEAPGNQRPRKW